MNLVDPLEHARPNQHVVLLGVVDRRGRYSNTKPTIKLSWPVSFDFKQTQASFLQYLIVWSPLQLTQVPKTPDQAVFVLTTTTTDGQNDYFTPCCACARGVNMNKHHLLLRLLHFLFWCKILRGPGSVVTPLFHTFPKLLQDVSCFIPYIIIFWTILCHHIYYVHIHAHMLC